MISLSCIQDDDPNFILSGANSAYNIITMYNREIRRFGNATEFPLRETYSLDEIINVLNMLLIGFCGQDNAATPGLSTIFLSIHC